MAKLRHQAEAPRDWPGLNPIVQNHISKLSCDFGRCFFRFSWNMLFIFCILLYCSFSLDLWWFFIIELLFELILGVFQANCFLPNCFGMSVGNLSGSTSRCSHSLMEGQKDKAKKRKEKHVWSKCQWNIHVGSSFPKQLGTKWIVQAWAILRPCEWLK